MAVTNPPHTAGRVAFRRSACVPPSTVVSAVCASRSRGRPWPWPSPARGCCQLVCVIRTVRPSSASSPTAPSAVLPRRRMCAEKFAREGVGVSITLTPCWCYGSETMDMDPLTPKAVWGFNGTERPGAVYLAAVLAAHNQKGLPAFGIYGRDVQDRNATRDPGGRRGEAPAFCAGGARCGLDAGPLVPLHGQRVHGHRRLHRGCGLLRVEPRHALRVQSTCPSSRGASRRGSTTRPSTPGPSPG